MKGPDSGFWSVRRISLGHGDGLASFGIKVVFNSLIIHCI